MGVRNDESWMYDDITSKRLLKECYDKLPNGVLKNKIATFLKIPIIKKKKQSIKFHKSYYESYNNPGHGW